MNNTQKEFTGTLIGYTELLTVLFKEDNLESVLKRDIELNDFPDVLFDVRCFDGIAIATTCPDADGRRTNVVLTYPQLESMDMNEKCKCLEYLGFLINPKNINYNTFLFNSNTTLPD